MLKSLYLTNRFFFLCAGVILLFVSGFIVPLLYTPVIVLLILLGALLLFDLFQVFGRETQLEAGRQLPRMLSLGDENKVRIHLNNKSGYHLDVELVDELPYQLQERHFSKAFSIAPLEEVQITYTIRPLERGEYVFGDINCFVSTRLGLAQRRMAIPSQDKAPVYPSILQMKQFELKAFDRVTLQKGIKKIRRIGHSYEFEQIKNYVRGDDYRSINWKASSRKAALMVNQYEDERAQQVYSIIDKSRAMRMPFEGLSLMDYAINTSLVISNIALQKHDKAGLITFSDKIGSTIKADSKTTQLNKILAALYKEKERPLEANYELLYYITRKLILGRSLILLYTNFESSYALERVLPVLRKINKVHLLVVIFFENTEIRDFAEKEVSTLEDIYHQTVAQQFLAEKSQMVQKLNQYGIQAILTRPQDLSINTVNKYLELKSRGLI